ncbi:MAG TPA: UvrB/UvrC motif-containing protein [Candidatus Pacearchaeota archaeon]|nr:UvrB/UvrC motif-containing protein [Candidatus Pacearchaeota archaeon]HOC53520.1 UvrB/UvrC motif-containing protein [Candidatus Pacearchaeota archaeon]HQM24406.1 UvrB/UvrC motif-containing protein [Candidatus Pacearchaeota archaeon]
MINKEKIKNIPDSPGIYLFYKGKNLIYVGKATSLKSRVRSYLNPKTFRPIETLIHEVNRVKIKETDSVLEAIILEAEYIKKFKPKYNAIGKDDKSWIYLVVTKEDFPKLIGVRGRNLENNYLYTFGPFAQIKTSEILKLLHSLFKVSRCNPNSKRHCFDYQLGNCLGVCINEISSKDYKKKVIKPLALFLKGQKKKLIKELKKEMEEASLKEKFEEAKRLRNQIFSLEKIRDFSLLDKSFLEEKFEDNSYFKRIEGYDISNLGKTNKVGSMVVFVDGIPSKKDYKKFKIKTVEGQSDVDCLREIMERRIKHKEWPLPQLILVDGGKPQVNTIKKVLKENKINIEIVGIAKGKQRKKNEFINWKKGNEDLLIKVRDEAHRFAIKYQRNLRKL